MEDGVYKNNAGIPQAVIITITIFSLHLIFPLSVIFQAAVRNQANNRYLQRV